MGARLAKMASADVLHQSSETVKQLCALEAFQSSRRVSLYLPMDDGKELDTWDLLASGTGASCCCRAPLRRVHERRAFLPLPSRWCASGVPLITLVRAVAVMSHLTRQGGRLISHLPSGLELT